MIRLARAPDGTVRVRPDAPGRGAYVCFDQACVEHAIRSGKLRKALRLEGAVPEAVVTELQGRIWNKGGQTEGS
jgi:predicted RNA-binding protein YlxR (DUF448 family)